MNKTRLKVSGELTLTVAALIWGTAFVAQSLGSDILQSFTYTGVRNIIGALVLLCTVRILNVRRLGTPSREEYRVILKGGAICGVFLFVASNAQQLAISWTDAQGNKALVGKVGFITTLYIVLVPVLGIFLKKKTSPKVWLSVAIALVGAYLLTMNGGAGRLTGGDVYALIGALMFAFQIVAVDVFAPQADCLRLSMVEFAVCGVSSLIAAFIFETPKLSDIFAARWSLMYTGILSSGVAYTLQMIGQKRCRPQVASLIMSLESVFCALAGFIFMKQKLSLQELAGCALMLAAVVLTQLGSSKAEQGNEK